MGNAIAWFEIYVDNMDRAKAFYEAVFQTNLKSLIPGGHEGGLQMWAFPSDQNSYGAPGALVKMEGFAAGANSVIVYFACQDCAVEEARVQQFGGRIHRPKTSIGEYGFISLVYDTEGNLIGLFSMA